MKHLALLTAITATTPACAIHGDRADDPDVADVEQGVHTVRGCDVTVNLAGQATSETVGIHGVRHYAYNCDKIYFHVTTGGRDWRATTTQHDDAGSDYTACTHEHLRASLERVAPSPYGNLGTVADWGDPYPTGWNWPGTGFPIYACHPPSVPRDLGAGHHYQLAIIAEGEEQVTHDLEYKDFLVTFSPL